MEVIKGWVPGSVRTPEWLWPVVSAVLAVALCVLAGVDVLAVAGVWLEAPVVGSVLTGVLISRGANFTHDIWGKLTENRLP